MKHNKLSSLPSYTKIPNLSMRGDIPVLRKDAESSTAIVSLGVSSDAVSLASNDSKRRIITKQVQWSVARDSGTRP